MRARLLHPDRDFDAGAELPPHADDLVQDLELATILRAAAGSDELIWAVWQRALLAGGADVAEIGYRQDMLDDCRRSPELIRELYRMAGEALESKRRVFRSLSRDRPHTIVSRSVEMLGLLEGFLRELRALADAHASAFAAAGFARFFAMIADELDDDYLAELHERLAELAFPRGTLIGAHLGPGNRAIEYVARRHAHRGLLERVNPLDRSGYSFTIPPRDEAGFEALTQIQDRGVNEIANVVGQSCDHVLAFFAHLRTELGFYVGALNLGDRLSAIAAPTCRAEVCDRELAGTAHGLYDVALALRIERPPVANDVRADGRPLTMITGANQGGKSTLLRALGQAQLMGQAGLMVGAERLEMTPCTGLFTHYRREEDAAMESGKLDEELVRMSGIVDRMSPGALLLCNESFASTNEREGSEIARQIVRALLDAGVRVAFVTHQYDLASSFFHDQRERSRTLFLRAGRNAWGARSYRLAEAPPEPTSYGADSYREVFGSEVGGR